MCPLGATGVTGPTGPARSTPAIGSVWCLKTCSDAKYTVIEVDQNVVLKNDTGWFHTTRLDVFLETYKPA